MTQTAVHHTMPPADDAVRLRLDPVPSRATALDGGWWPRSSDATVELRSLVKALTGLRGQITHVLLNTAGWDLPHPRRATTGTGEVRLGWYTSQPAGLVTVMTDYGRDRFDLLIVPAGASRESADTALTAAADPTDTRRTAELITEIEHTH